MNKKLLFGIMSLAALTACTNDDFESQKVAENVSPIQFEVINDGETRASMDGNSIVWNADEGDIFTLYHGAAAGAVSGFENAIYKANRNADGATLTTPSMIKQGRAIMVWPADTTFRIKSGDDLTITIPDVQIPSKEHGDIANIIPYVSDLVNIGARTETDYKVTDYNTAGYQRKYPVYMRPMASQLTLRADFGDTENELKKLYEGGTDPLIDGDPITEITVTSVSLLTQDGGTTMFTKTIPVKWTDPGDALAPGTIAYQWKNSTTGENLHNAWEKITDFNIATIATKGAQVAKLTTKCLVGNESSKFLILPQAEMAAGTPVDKGAVEVNTYYGKVLIAKKGEYAESKYTDDEYNKAWYRIVSEAKVETDNENASTPGTGDFAGKFKVVAKSTGLGMAQTLNDFSGHKAGSGITKNEPCGYSLNRYVNVNLAHLDMAGLHIKSDKQLRDVVRVWKKMNLDDVTVYLDGDKVNGVNNVFTISQKTIKVINDINASIAGGAKSFKVMPCQEDGEKCETIVITGSSQIQNVQDIAFIKNNGGKKAYVALADEGEAKPWIWDDDVKVDETGVAGIINNGVMQNAETKTLRTLKPNGTQNNVELANNGTWNITAGTVNVQFTVWNLGKVNIAKGAQYREDGGTHFFYNYAAALPTRFGGDDNKIGKVENKGVFATVDDGEIWNIGLIEHADKDAKTYITKNQWGTKYTNPTFAEAFAYDENHVEGNANMIGRINLPYSNKDEDNVSVSAALEQGFVSVTVDGEVTGALSATQVGPRVNYVIVKSGVTSIADMPAGGQVKYLEINMEDKSEIAWSVSGATTYEGLIVLSPVNIKLGTTISATVTYLGADMYVGGTFNNGTTDWDGYYGNTAGNVKTKYITY